MKNRLDSSLYPTTSIGYSNVALKLDTAIVITKYIKKTHNQ